MAEETTVQQTTTEQQQPLPKQGELPQPIKKRPRPANLELKNSNLNNNNNNSQKDMEQYAIKCLSPGLPPLDPAMQSTFLISKSIEAQQRQLIAARQTPTGLTAPLESLSIPSSTKRLKRNAPPPLNLSSSTTPIRPTIMSAPSHHYAQFQQFFTPHTASKQSFGQTRKRVKIPPPQQQHAFTPMTPYGIRKPLLTSIPHRTSGNFFRGGVKTGVPKSAVGYGPPRTGQPRYRGFRMKRDEGVVDVFTRGERMAPLVAQPLSAQREFFDRGEINIKPKSAVEKKEKEKGTVISQEKINEESESDVESNAIEPEAKVGLIRKPEIDGELRILNNVFKFEFSRVDDENDKERFLKHCARAWDEFTKLGN